MDIPKIYGEGNLDAVEIVIESGGLLDMQAGTMKNFVMPSGQTHQLEVVTGATFNMAGGAYLTASDLSTAGSGSVLLIDGGTVTVSSSAFIAGSGNYGSGVEIVNGGQMTGDGLTVSNMDTGIMNTDGTLTMDSYTSTANTNGVKADSGTTTTLTNSQISDAAVAVDILGGADVSMDGMDIDDSAIGVRTAGTNTVSMSGLDVDGTLGTTPTYGVFTTSTSSGTITVSNSDFNGISTGIYLGAGLVTISDTAISNGVNGVQVSSQSSSNHVLDSVTLTGNDVSVKLDGTGTISMADVDITSVTTDIEITDSSLVNFLDGSVDSSAVVFATGATGSIDRDRSFVATITADGNPVANTNVLMSSKEAETTSTGITDSNGVTSGLSFSIYDLDAQGTTDYSSYFNTYSLSTVAMVNYQYTSSTDNDADFRYIQDQPTLVDAAVDQVNLVNAADYSLVNTIDVRICTSNSGHSVVAPCAGTMSSSSSRPFLNNLVEYGDNAGLHSGSTTMDLTGKAIMVDTGIMELHDDTNYILDGAIVFHTGYVTSDGYSQWVTDIPYGTTITMDGGEVNGVYSSTAAKGLLIGGKSGSSENALNYNINDVIFTNVASIATGAGDRTQGFGSSFSTYLPSQISITNSFIGHYRAEVVDRPTSFDDADYCIRISGTNSGTISGNTFSDCIVGIGFEPSYYAGSVSTVTHAVVGSDNVIIDDNDFVGTVAYNVRLGPNSDADSMTISKQRDDLWNMYSR